VWSREAGYPSDPEYRDFYRDIGFDRPASDLDGEVGPDGTRLMTGLKYHRITGPGPDKAPYRPALAEERARHHAAHFIARREETLSQLPRLSLPPPIAVAPYDAELFGHWWFEGPRFLEHVLRGLHASERRGRLAAVTLGGYLERHPEAAIAEPAASSWGAGGFGEVWVGPAASPRSPAHLWRTTHHAARQVQTALHLRRHATAAAGRALDQAVMELLLLQSSDWAFMIHRGDMAAYAEARVREHASRAGRLAELALSERLTSEDVGFIDAIRSRSPFLSSLGSEPIRDAWDRWESDGYAT
jgi:1,4-alpha-glucan branching enzyme